MKKNLKVDEYDPQIYSRKLWVATSTEGLADIFQFYMTDGTTPMSKVDAEIELADDGIEMCTFAVEKLSNGLYGALVVIPDVDIIIEGTIAHEAVHVADYICEQQHLNTESFSKGNEAYAYLVGWVAGCISKTIIKEKQNDI